MRYQRERLVGLGSGYRRYLDATRRSLETVAARSMRLICRRDSRASFLVATDAMRSRLPTPQTKDQDLDTFPRDRQRRLH